MYKRLKEYGFNTENLVYTIAEIGINHGGDIAVAKALIDSAAKTGVDAVKFQTYITEKRVPEGNQTLFDILKKCELPFEAFDDLKKHAESLGLTFFSTPFDKESIDYLESIHCDLYKIASFDVVNQKLLAKIAGTKKTVIMSVGMANMEEIKTAYSILEKSTEKIAILHCVSAYPTLEKDANLSAVHYLKEQFPCIIGQSDHTNGIDVPLFAVAAGAQVVEKHYKIDDQMDCIDAPVSITEHQMTNLVAEIRRLETVFGGSRLITNPAEEGTRQFRRKSQ